MKQHKTVRISVEVRSGTARFRVGVRAESIRKALSLVGGRYPNGVVRVLFPTQPEGYFVGAPSVPARATGREQAHEVAA